jgi:hypothetical protein
LRIAQAQEHIRAHTSEMQGTLPYTCLLRKTGAWSSVIIRKGLSAIVMRHGSIYFATYDIAARF